MGFWGTLIGGTLGWTLGGPLGAMLGAAIGSSMSGSARMHSYPGQGPGAPPPPPPGNSHEQRRVAFFVATFGVMGHIAKADGQVTEEEAQLAREVMEGLGLDARDRSLAARIFNEGKSPRFNLDDALGQLVQVAGRRRNLLRAFMGIQCKAAWADGSVHPEERRILDHIGAFLGFSRGEMAQMERVASAGMRPRGPSPEEKLKEAYGVLGAERASSDDEIRSTYRRRMRQHHPARLAAQGLPEERKEEATRRTQEIQKAYQTIREARRAA